MNGLLKTYSMIFKCNSYSKLVFMTRRSTALRLPKLNKINANKIKKSLKTEKKEVSVGHGV